MFGQYKVSNVYSGFRLLDVKEISDYNSIGYLFKHIKTDMEVYFLSSDDNECFFSYNIYTPPFDNTGVFHILEHTVLTGSKRFPVRDPFMTIDRNSCNTFLNAMTGPDRTYFPAASPVKKDFDNIFSVYTDAVFDSLLRKESFMQEGIRLVKTKNSLQAEGVVFSEMKGDISDHSSVVQSTINRFLFDEKSPYRFESGGNPPDIIDLSYEKFIETYRKYYVANNITLFLYGNLDIEEKLSFLNDNYLKDRERGEKIERAKSPKEWSEGKTVRATSDSDEDDDSASVMLSWLLGPSSDSKLNTLLSLLVDILLGNPGCPLYKRIIESGLGLDISSESGMNDSEVNLTFAVGVSGAEEKDSEKIKEMIFSSLREIVEEGLDKTLIEASIRRMEFRHQEIKEGLPTGYRIFFTRVDKGWAYGKNPSEMLEPRKEIQYIRESLEEDGNFFEKWIEKNLLNNSNVLLSIIVMDKNNSTKREAEIQRKIEERKGYYSDEDEKRYKKYEGEKDSVESLKSLPRLTLSDIPNITNEIKREEHYGIIVSPLHTNGIVYSDIAFDVSDLTIEELEYVSLLSRVITMTNVGELSYSEFLTKLRFSTGAFSSIFECGTTCSGKERDFLLIRFKSLNEHFKESLDLVLSLINEGDFSSSERISAVLKDIESDFESSVVSQAHLFSLTSSSRTFSPSLYISEKTQGLSYWIKIKSMLKQKSEDIGEKLKEVAEKVFSKNRVIYHLTCEDDVVDDFASLSSLFIKGIRGEERSGEASHIISTNEKKNIAYTFSTPVSYIALSAPVCAEDKNYCSSERMLISILSQSELWTLVREKGGAYGTGASLDITENIIYFYSYRDPRLDKTIDDFFLSIEKEDLTEEKLENAKLKVLAKDVRPVGPQSKGIVDLRRYLYEITDSLRRDIKESMLSVSLSDMEKAKSTLIEQLKNDNSITALTSSKMVKKSKNNFEVIPLPFGNI